VGTKGTSIKFYLGKFDFWETERIMRKLNFERRKLRKNNFREFDFWKRKLGKGKPRKFYFDKRNLGERLGDEF
jgi:hypothetical protein